MRLGVLALAAILDFQFFVTRVEPIFLKARCYKCHSLSSNQAAFRLEPLSADGKWTLEQSRRNFENALKVVDLSNPLKSRLLLHPLAAEAGGDEFHSGGKFWNSKSDPEWQTLARWVQGGRRARSRSRRSGR